MAGPWKVSGAGTEAGGCEPVRSLAVGEALRQALVGVRRADHGERRRIGDRDLSLGHAGVERADHTEYQLVGKHGLDVLHTFLSVVHPVDGVVKGHELQGIAAHGDGVGHGELCALLSRQTARCVGTGDREAAGDVDLAFGPTATARTAAGECDERRDDEDCESPSSNHMVPPCVCGKAPSGSRLPLIRRPLPNLSWYLDDDRGESAPAANAATWGGRTYYSVQNFTIGSANLAEFALIWV